MKFERGGLDSDGLREEFVDTRLDTVDEEPARRSTGPIAPGSRFGHERPNKLSNQSACYLPDTHTETYRGHPI